MTAAPLCRFCRTPLTDTFVDLGRQPLANSYLTAEALAAGTERSYPLHARVCHACFLVQVDDVVPADAIFDAEYAYFSSYSASWVAHARRYADAMTGRFGLGPESLVVEIASNDGYLLQHFVARDIPVLGIEPTANTAEAARARGVPTDVLFFNDATGRELAARGVRADLMAANNVLAHVPDIADFVAGFRHVLKPADDNGGGVVTFEFPHLLNLIEKVQFDTIYHEHFSYLSLLAVEQVLRSAGLRVFDVALLPTHGGSLRLFVCHAGSGREETEALRALRAHEDAAGLDRIETYQGFTPQVEAVRASFRAFLTRAKAEGRRIAAYGAAAKGNTFLNYCGASAADIVAVFDANPAKQGRFLPGSHIPILAPAEVRALRPDDVLILPWNLKDEVMGQLAYVAEWGGRFVTASPETKVVG
jgi:SAM-dependent methyltransferase